MAELKTNIDAKMKQILPLNIATFISFVVIFSIAYYFLLQDNFLHISISGIISRAHYLALKKHLLVLGLLPIYIATVVFGAAILSVQLGSTLSGLIARTCKN